MASSSAARIVVFGAQGSWIPNRRSRSHSSSVVVSVSACSSSSSSSSAAASTSTSSSEVPKLEPFTQSRSARGMRQPTLLEKAEHALQDECTVLDGDEAFECYDALFEFEKIKETSEEECAATLDEDNRSCHPLERLENLVRQSGGVTTLIKNLTVLAGFGQGKKTPRKSSSPSVSAAAAAASSNDQADKEELFLEPDSIPKTPEELEQEESAKLPESAFSRLLKRRGLPSLWFGQRPEHETD